MLKIFGRYRPREYDSEDGPWDPITGATSALLGTMGSLMMGVADMPVEVLRALRIKPSDQGKGDGRRHGGSTSSTDRIHSESLRPASTTSSVDLPQARSMGTSTESLSTQESNALETNERTEPGSSPQEQASGLENEGQPLSPNSTPDHRSILAKSLRRSSSRSRSPRRDSTADTSDPHRHSVPGSQTGRISLEAALGAGVGAGKGVGRMVGVGLKSPMDFTLGIARGFHNAPKLYGDETVRQADKVTDFQSGLKTAGKVRSSLCWRSDIMVLIK